MCQKKKDELKHKHTLMFLAGARTGQTILTAERKDHTIKRNHLDQTEVLLCRTN